LGFVIMCQYILYTSGSRAALIMLLLITLLNFGYLFIKYKGRRKLFTVVIVLCFIALAIVFSNYPSKSMHKLQYRPFLLQDSPRHRINNFSFELFKKDIFLGTGMHNFPNFKLEDIKENLIEDKGLDFWTENKHLYMPFKHPHNLYFAYLTGGGLLLFSAIFLFYFESIKGIRKAYITNAADHFLLITVSSIILINLLVGLVNNTFTHEHGIFSALFIGILFSKLSHNSTG